MHRSHRLLWAAAVVVAGAAIAVAGWARYAGRDANGTLLYQSGFEAPAYFAGELRFANGWQVSPREAWSAITVQPATVFSGGLAVRIAAAGMPNFTRAIRRIGFDSRTSTAKSVSISVDAQLSASGTPSQWELITAFDDAKNFIALLGVKTSGELFVRQYGGSTLDTHVFLHRGVWNHAAMNINFRANTLTAYLNGQRIVSGFGFDTPLIGSLGRIGFEIGTAEVGTDVAYFDNFSVRAVP